MGLWRRGLCLLDMHSVGFASGDTMGNVSVRMGF